MTPIPVLDRTSATFKADVDTFFGSQLPAFATEANALQADVTAKQGQAATSATNAATSEGNALASKNAAAISATNAATSEGNALASKNAAAGSFASLDTRYLGAKAVAPMLDNDGNALLIGAMYWDTALPGMCSWNGSAWVTLPAATAAAISNTPAGGIAATTVQAAINELDSEKVAKTDVIAIANGGTGATTANAAADAIGAFRRGTLLGAVSQSAGVPTGAVIERGSNANGQYVRFADGTQICTHFVSVTGPNEASGQIFISASNTWTFPAVFWNTPAFYANEVGGNGFTWAGLGAGAASNTGTTFLLYRSVAATVSSDVTLCAIGRWF
jgi:hypothetical protein